MYSFIEFLKAVIIGIVEGITEWLPVSSTGHMLLLDRLMPINLSDQFYDLFIVVIQLGAILAVPILYFEKLNPFSRKKSREECSRTLSLWGKVIVGVLPAAVMGLLFDDIIEEKLFSHTVVAIALVVYGVLFIAVELLRGRSNKPYRVNSVYDLTLRDCLTIGAFQVLSLIPGTSRSGSTILGGIMSGVCRSASAEFSFFMAIPVMLGASLLKIVKFIAGGFAVSGFELAILFVGIFTSFIVSVVAIRFLTGFVKRHSFSSFGVYRIVLGIAVLLFL